MARSNRAQLAALLRLLLRQLGEALAAAAEAAAAALPPLQCLLVVLECVSGPRALPLLAKQVRQPHTRLKHWAPAFPTATDRFWNYQNAKKHVFCL